jgi:CRISPR-associated protein (TIGR02710 family)
LILSATGGGMDHSPAWSSMRLPNKRLARLDLKRSQHGGLKVPQKGITMSHPSVLLCTVGTGNIDLLRETLLEPLKKSIRKGEWSRVVLLPSQLTQEHAAKLRDEVQDVPIVIQQLPRAGAEDDADACFAHFDKVLEELRAQGFPPEALLVDFTRGTKAMSAALVLAAIRHDLPQLRYISGGKRDERGMVVPGTEIVAEVHTTIATARKRLDDAHRFMHHGNFAAVLEILPDPASSFGQSWPPDLADLAVLVRALAAFYAAWDRLDYKGAQKQRLSICGLHPPAWNRFVPPPEIRNWVASLAQQLPEENPDRAAPLRLLVADLLANGERRLRHHQYEDAIIRGYRVLELVGQIRLFEHGLASDALPPDHAVVKAFQDELLADAREEPLTMSKGMYQAPREKVARLLKRLGDPLAKALLRLGNRAEGEIKLSKRNYSIWIHGFEAIAGSDSEPIQVLLADLEQLLITDGGQDATHRLQCARWPDFSRSR